jgi:hypothetical protein
MIRHAMMAERKTEETTMRRVLIAALMSLLPLAAAAQHSEEVIDAQLTAMAQMMGDAGFQQQRHLFNGDIHSGALASGVRARVEVTLPAGRYYIVGGVCGLDCSNMNLRITRSGANSPVWEDSEADDVPIVDFTTDRAGVYQIEVTMVACNASSCPYGVAIYSR